MRIIENITEFLQFKMEIPTMYGWFHILCLALIAVIIAVLAWKKPDVKKTILVISSIMLFFEVIRELIFSYDNGIWRYQWYIFPFQFCATPMYVGFIAGITKNKKLEQALFCFLATYGVVAGILTVLYPATLYVSETLINIQAMVHHGFMVVMGMHILITGSVKKNIKTIISAFKVFIILVAIALMLDISTYYLNIGNGLEMFFVSPFHTSQLPVFNVIYANTPYIIFLIIYLVVFTLGGIIPICFLKGNSKINK